MVSLSWGGERSHLSTLAWLRARGAVDYFGGAITLSRSICDAAHRGPSAVRRSEEVRETFFSACQE